MEQEKREEAEITSTKGEENKTEVSNVCLKMINRMISYFIDAW